MPHLSHGFLYVSDLSRCVRFYTSVFGFHASPERDGFVALDHPEGAGLALHAVPEAYAQDISSPAVWRKDTAHKLCYRVEDLTGLRARVLEAGGQAEEPWSWDEQVFCECADPEGNVFQIFGKAMKSPSGP